MDTVETHNLQQMKERIDGIERLAEELAALGRGVPAVEKNAHGILCAVYNLKFGISDVADLARPLSD